MWEILTTTGAYGGVLIWEITKGILLWGPIGLVICLVLYFAGTRLRLLDIRGEKKRWPRVIYGLVLFLVAMPLIALSGGVTKARNAQSEIILTEVKKQKLTVALGNILSVPIVLAHLVAESEIQNPNLEEMASKILAEGDVSFMLDPKLKGRAFAKLTGDMIKAGLQNNRMSERLRESTFGSWLYDKAIDMVLSKAMKKVEFYDLLFKDIQAGPDGKLTYESMADQVGEKFIREKILLRVEDIFNAFRTKLLIIAFLAIALTVGIIRIYSWKFAK